jgi:hypothetical protein
MSIGTALGLTGLAAGLATAGTVGAGVTAAGGLASSLIGSSAAKTAASDQEQASEAAIAEQQREFNTQQQNYAPWLAAGTGALSQLTAGTAPGGSLVAPYPGGAFTAPTGVDESNDPGYAFRLAQGDQAISRAAAAGGGAFSGGTLKALSRYGQDYASNEYQNVYNRALTGYNTNFNTYNLAQGNTFNRLASIAGMGQTATGQLGQLGQTSSGTISNLLTGQGNAAAAGTLGSASAINSGLNSLVGGTNNGLNLYTSGQLLSLLTGGTNPGPQQALPLQNPTTLNLGTIDPSVLQITP